MAITVTATCSGTGSVTGTDLFVRVLTGAIEPGGASGALAGGASTPPDVSVTPNFSSSLILAACLVEGSQTAFTPASGNTFDVNAADSTNNYDYGMCRYTGTVTSGVAVTVGATAPSGAGMSGFCAAYEVHGTPVVDASSPAVVAAPSALSAQTASFTPPPGSVLVAMVAQNGLSNSGTLTVTMSDTSGLAWTQRAKSSDAAADGAAWVFTATVPAAGGIAQALPGRTWLRRFHHRQAPQSFPVAAAAPAAPAGSVPPLVTTGRRSRALFRALVGNGASAGAGTAAPFQVPAARAGSLVRTRRAAGAVTGHAYGTVAPLPVQPRGSVSRRRAARVVFAGVAVAPVLAHAATGGLVAHRDARQHPRAVAAHVTGAPAPVVPGQPGSPPGGLVVRRAPTGAVTGGFASAAIRTTTVAGTVPPHPAVGRRYPARAVARGTIVRTVNAIPPATGSQPGGLVIRRAPVGAVAAGFAVPPPLFPQMFLLRPQVTSRRPVAAVWGGPGMAVRTVNAHGPAGKLQPRATVPVPRRYPARSGAWHAIQGSPPPSFFVARSTSTVTDPRDGTDTVTATATSSSSVTDPRDGTPGVT